MNTSPTQEQRHLLSPTTGLCLLAALLLSVLSLLFIYFEWNRVGSVTLDVGSYVTEEDVNKIIGDLEGDFLPMAGTEEMKEKICALSPMVADVVFEVRFPRRLHIHVIDEEYAYYFTAENGKVLLLNRDFKFLSFHDADAYESSACDYRLEELTELYVQEPSVKEAGALLEFAHKEELSEFLSVLRKAKGVYYQELNVLDLRNLRTLTLVMDGLIRIELSEHTDLPAKLSSVLQMMKKNNTRQEKIPTHFTFVRPARKEESPHWAVAEWVDIYSGYTLPPTDSALS